MSCRRRCSADLLFSCLRGFPFGVRTCVHGRAWQLKIKDNFYVAAMWSSWRRRWIAVLVEGVRTAAG